MQSRAVRVPMFAVLLILALALQFTSCSFTPEINGGASTERSLVLITAPSWCAPCNRFDNEVLPQLKRAGLQVVNFRDKQHGHIHLVNLDHDPDPRGDWPVTNRTAVPHFVVFEAGRMVEERTGFCDSETVFEMLNRHDLINAPQRPALPEPPKTLEPIAEASPSPKADATKSNFDQLVEFIGQDTVTMTLTLPNGRKVPIEAANASASLPETLTAHAKVVGDAIVVDFDKPQILAEGRRLGIRLGTNIPGVKFTRDNTVQFRTGLGIPFTWKLETHPFSAAGLDAADDAAGN